MATKTSQTARKRAVKNTKTTKTAGAAKRAAARRPAKPAKPVRRVGLMELGGKPATIVGADVRVGQKAPNFTSQVGLWPGYDLWAEVDPLAATAGKVRILAAVPSLDTPTCDLETRRFNTEAANLGEGILIVTISTDLPPSQKRWCGAAGKAQVVTVSDHMTTEFGVKYGCLMAERRWLRRAVFVVGSDDKVVYAAYMPKLGDQPDYDAVLAAARAALPA
ncbi:MAG: thiol peroxidase [Anaerolineales bacterium]|nr:thiol peroxidase [Anaerolineales bacterium]